MPDDQSALIGHVLDVRGDAFLADLSDSEEGTSLTVTIGDEDIAIGRLGSYVEIRQGAIRIIGMVARMTEREKLPPLASESGMDEYREPAALRTLQIVPVGSLTSSGEFERGVSSYPTTGAEVHAIARDDISLMFRRFESTQFDIGALSSNPELRIYLDPSPLFGKHCAILGQTGAGKSWTVASLLQKAVRTMPHAHIILLDLHGEYRTAFAEDEVRHIEATDLEIPYWLMTFSELCDLLIDRSEFTAHNQIAFFRDTLNNLKQEEGRRLALQRVTVDTPIHFSLTALKDAIASENSRMVQGRNGMIKGPLHGDFDHLLIRLDSRLNDVRYDFLLKPQVRSNSASLEGLLRDFVGLGDPRRCITVIDLSPVPFDVRPTVTAQIGRLVFEFNYWNPSYRQFPLLLVCEEAHAYIKRESDAVFEGARKSMERIAKEGRKYGVGLLVVSQRPHELSETVLSQCGTFICLRMTNPDDQNYIRKLVPEAERDLVNILAGLRRGEALVLGDAAALPGRVLIDPPEPKPMSDDVDFHGQWTSGPDDIDVAEVVDSWRRQARKT
jgi:hypothetical protein